MAHGFLTSMEPILVSEMPKGELIGDPVFANGIPNLSLGYVKGSARMSTLQAILALCYQDHINLQQDPV